MIMVTDTIKATSHPLRGYIKRVGMALAFIFVPLLALAQSGLHSNAVFNGEVVPRAKLVEVKVRGRSISKYGLSFYHSVRFDANAGQVAKTTKLVAMDMNSALSAENRDKGDNHSLILSLPKQGNKYRYLCYMYGKGKKNVAVTLVYMEGSVSSIDKLRSLIK